MADPRVNRDDPAWRLWDYLLRRNPHPERGSPSQEERDAQSERLKARFRDVPHHLSDPFEGYDADNPVRKRKEEGDD